MLFDLQVILNMKIISSALIPGSFQHVGYVPWRRISSMAAPQNEI
jgi:hypothetical protein